MSLASYQAAPPRDLWCTLHSTGQAPAQGDKFGDQLRWPSLSRGPLAARTHPICAGPPRAAITPRQPAPADEPEPNGGNSKNSGAEFIRATRPTKAAKPRRTFHYTRAFAQAWSAAAALAFRKRPAALQCCHHPQRCPARPLDTPSRFAERPRDFEPSSGIPGIPIPCNTA
jgi:hypothetical protein